MSMRDSSVQATACDFALDADGNKIAPYDIVLVQDLSSFAARFEDDDEREFIEGLSGCLALITYQQLEEGRDKIHWCSDKYVFIDVLYYSNSEDGFGRYVDYFPYNAVKKIQSNSSLLSVFIPFYEFLRRDESTSSYFNFSYIERVLAENLN